MAVALREPIPWGYSKKVMREIIDGRIRSVRRQPQLIEIDPWDLSDIFYTTRKRLDAEGYDISPLNRKQVNEKHSTAM